jgi:hypothetical protein
VSIAVIGHRDARVAQPLLYHLGGQAQAAVLRPIDAPGSVEVAKGVKAGVLGLASLGWDQTAIDDVGQRLHLADTVGEREITLALGAFELPFLQSVRDKLAEGHRALTCRRLGLADLVEPIGALPDVQFISLEVDVPPPQPAEL